ncbi:hypothetical protein TNIN_296061 [Trichonephila inaurata madagascariensis]|uniref:A-kinase anchor protein 17A n=1 Tax=Trichonephila inaurata madagascariensis TaxID=2747483 RepID=A0A8X7BR43_9ARAC|nr:hypothetical protein TNIN_296061 [Trichonephila inaurata madagascariensis]
MPLQTCSDTTEAIIFESSLGLYLKPISKIKINVQLPKLNSPGQSLSNWHVMEKLKETVRPVTFLYLKALKITATVIKFEGELETKSSCDRALARLKAAGSLKLNGFSERLQIRAAHGASGGPMRHDWESFFRDAKGVNEMKPGERPDTIHLEEVPVRWFAESGKSTHPNEKLLRKAFGTFGKIRRLEIPSKTTSEHSTFGKTSSLHNDLLFEVYIQYEEYVEFVIAMESLSGKKLLYKEADGKVYSADIKVDFDRNRYLSDKCIKQRTAETKKIAASVPESTNTPIKDQQMRTKEVLKFPLVNKTLVIETKVNQPSIEDKNAAKMEAKYLLKELLHRAEVSERERKDVKTSNPQKEELRKDVKTIAKEKSELHYLKKVKEKHTDIHRNRSNKELYRQMQNNKGTRHKDKHQHNEKRKKKHLNKMNEGKKIKEKFVHTHDRERKNKERLLEQEQILKEKLLRNLKEREEKKLKVREKLRKELAGSKVLKSVLVTNRTNV